MWLCRFTHRSHKADIAEKWGAYSQVMVRETAPDCHQHGLSPTDLAVLRVLVNSAHKVMSRETISRMAGLEADSARRADTSLVALRRALGHDSITTVRRRGWVLTDSGLQAANDLLGPQV